MLCVYICLIVSIFCIGESPATTTIKYTANIETTVIKIILSFLLIVSPPI